MHPWYVTQNAKQNPAPDFYFNLTVHKTNGPTMRGRGSEYLCIIYVSSEKHVQSDKHSPGPGSYMVHRNFGMNASKYSIGQKLKKLEDQTIIPSSSDYFPKLDVIQNTRFKKIGIGYGNKYDLTSTFERTPGPGAYNMLSKFDLHRKKSGSPNGNIR